MTLVGVVVMNLSQLITPKFTKWWRKEDKYLHKVLKGGRSSGKSTTIALKLIFRLISSPTNILCIRRVANTLKDSCYEQLKQAIDDMGVSNFFRCTLNPLEIVYLPTRQRILFRGSDDPAKIKSIKSSRYPISIVWFEELAEFRHEDDVRLIINSVVRAELPNNLKYHVYYSYNPPKRKQSWVNKKYGTVSGVQDNTLVHYSTFYDNPYNSLQSKEEAEETKLRNESQHRWEYLGEPIGGGITPFSNLVIRKIEEIETLDKFSNGIDWGWSIDPTHFVRLSFCRNKLYILDEIRGVKLKKNILANSIIKRKYNDVFTIGDSASPESNDELRSLGVKCYGAKKGPGSVEFGLEWLDGLDSIIIDPYRAKFCAQEFETIDYKLDRDGNIITELEDKNDHSIDATRYGCENWMKSKSNFFKGGI